MSPVVSVIIPTYNRAATIRSAVNSVLAQTFTDFELIVIDDGSQDATEAVLAGVGDDRLRVLTQANSGRNVARNHGIKEARGKYVAFLDSDDAWLPQHLERQVVALDAAPNNVALHIESMIFLTRQGARLSVPPAPAYDQPVQLPQLGADLLFPFVFQSWLVRRDILYQVGGIDPAIPSWEEHELLGRIVPHWRVIVSREVACVHYETAGSWSLRITGFNAAISHKFVEGYATAYGQKARIRAKPQFIAGWCNLCFDDFAAGRRRVWHSLFLDPLSLRTWIHALLSLLGQRAYRATRRWI